MKTTKQHAGEPLNKVEKENIAIMYIGNNIKIVYELATLYSFNVNLKHQFNYEKALDDIKHFKFYPDVVICDQYLNDKSGLEVFDLIQTVLPVETYKIVITNAKPNLYLNEIATRSKINETIKFPFNKETLSDKLRMMIATTKRRNYLL